MIPVASAAGSIPTSMCARASTDEQRLLAAQARLPPKVVLRPYDFSLRTCHLDDTRVTAANDLAEMV